MADRSEAERSATLSEFAQITTADANTARRYLEENEWDLNGALRSFYYDQDEGDDEPAAASAPSGQPQSAAIGTNPSRSAAGTSRPPPQRKTFGTLRDLGGGSNDDDDSEKEQEYFAGGDKSGLAVQDPNDSSNSAADHIRRLLDTARRNGPPPPEDQQQGATRFSGQGQTLGGDDVESRVIPDPNANTPRPPPMAERTLHLWADGFSVDDGPLYRYDDPANNQILSMINSGSAPLDIMNVESGQAVDVKLATHKGENYVQPKKKYAAFGSGGQRLGSPTQGAGPSTAPPSTTSAAAASSTPAASSSAAAAPKPDVDDSQPTVSLQIRLADGTRLPSRFNTSHTIGDVYAFVDQASSTGGRAYSLATTFPTKELTDKTQVLGDMAEFKRGGVIVQKWT